MKKFIIHLIIIIPFITNSQTIEVKYRENRIVTQEYINKLPEEVKKVALKKNYYNLNFNSKDGTSLYVNDSLTKNINTNNESEEKNDREDYVEIKIQKSQVTYKNAEKYYYKNLKENLMLFEFFNGDQLFNGKDSLQNWEWNITDEKKKIEGYLCKKATSNWLGYQFTAWFTEDIAVNLGPEKFDGLPGLILYVGTPYFEFCAESIKITKKNMVIEKPFCSGKTYTLNEINNIMTKKINNLKSSETTEQEGNKTTTKKSIIFTR
jgi:GLPGLI family protein